MENPTDTTSSTWWAGLALMVIMLVACTCCLVHTENKAARGYTYSVMSATTALVIGILLACQFVPFLTLGHWRTSWVMELLMFIVGFILLHFCCWKCQFSPVRRIIICIFCGYIVGASGAVAFVDLREALFGWGYEDSVVLAWCLLLGTSVLMALLHYLTKRLGEKQFAEPSPASWPPPPELTTISKPRSCATTRTCMGMPGTTEEQVDPVKENEWSAWDADAVWAEYVAMTTVMAFALYNLLRAVASSWTDHRIWMVWLVFILVIIAIVACIHQCIRRSKKKLEESGNLDGRDWHADAVIVGILTRVLGLCLVGGLRKMNPGLRQQLQDWFGVSVFYGYLMELVLMSFLVLVAIAILSCVFREAETFSGIFEAYVYPMEVEGFAIVLGIVWSLFISGMLGDLVRFSSWSVITWNVAWWHAVVSILMAAFLTFMWRRFILRKAAMDWNDHGNMLDNEKQVYESMRRLNPSW